MNEHQRTNNTFQESHKSKSVKKYFFFLLDHEWEWHVTGTGNTYMIIMVSRTNVSACVSGECLAHTLLPYELLIQWESCCDHLIFFLFFFPCDISSQRNPDYWIRSVETLHRILLCNIRPLIRQLSNRVADEPQNNKKKRKKKTLWVLMLFHKPWLLFIILFLFDEFWYVI